VALNEIVLYVTADDGSLPSERRANHNDFVALRHQSGSNRRDLRRKCQSELGFAIDDTGSVRKCFAFDTDGKAVLRENWSENRINGEDREIV
jgi:hypothetical protein